MVTPKEIAEVMGHVERTLRAYLANSRDPGLPIMMKNCLEMVTPLRRWIGEQRSIIITNVHDDMEGQEGPHIKPPKASVTGGERIPLTTVVEGIHDKP